MSPSFAGRGLPSVCDLCAIFGKNYSMPRHYPLFAPVVSHRCCAYHWRLAL